MSIANSVSAFLQAQGIPYTVLPRPSSESLEQAARASNLSLQHVARTVVLKDGEGMLMAVLPASHMLDFAVLNERLWRDLELAPVRAITEVLKDCEPLAYPPLGPAYGIDVVVDQSLLGADPIYFASGRRTGLVRVSNQDFQRLLGNARHDAFACPVPGYDPPANLPLPRGASRPSGMYLVTQRLIENIDGLPALPQMAQRILELRSNPKADAEDLARVVELDPSLALQVMRYASSPFYSYHGTLSSVRDAIARVLGFDVVMNLALGLAVGKSFKLPRHGPLGLDAYWPDAVCSAVLSQQMALYTPFDSRDFSSMAYLAGLLHNVGYLVLGYVFPRELSLLNKLILANPDMAVIDLERHVMGVSHEQVGAWVATAWNLPKQLIAAIRWHHSERYQGQHALFAQLMLTVDRLLKRDGRGDAPHGGLPLTVLDALGFSEEQAALVAQSVLGRCDDLDALAREFSH